MSEIRFVRDETWLICGGRDFDDQDMFNAALSDVMDIRGGCPKRVIHGAASGADTLAGKWAERLALEVCTYPADWAQGRSAGPIRNQRMIDDGRPAIVIAFPGGRGTADMVRRAQSADIDVIEIKQATEPRHDG